MSTIRSRTTGFSIAVALLGAGLAAAGCASSPRETPSWIRQADYLASQRELPPDIARAMEAGHILPDMDTKQVWVVLGDPARQTRFARTATDVWLYRAGRLRQDHFRLGTEGVRLIFVNDRLVVIEPM